MVGGPSWGVPSATTSVLVSSSVGVKGVRRRAPVVRSCRPSTSYLRGSSTGSARVAGRTSGLGYWGNSSSSSCSSFSEVDVGRTGGRDGTRWASGVGSGTWGPCRSGDGRRGSVSSRDGARVGRAGVTHSRKGPREDCQP